MKKQFFRVKQLADQTFLKADKSEVLNHEELQIADQRVESLRSAISSINKKICPNGPINDREKRLKKCLEYQLGTTFVEESRDEKECILFQHVLKESGRIEHDLAKDYAEHEAKVEEMVFAPLQKVIENELPSILKQKHNLKKYCLDKDSASNRYHATKKETLKEDMEEADTKVEQSRDALAIEMFNFLARENEFSSYILQLLKLQRGYHESALKNLETIIPELERKIGDSPIKRVFGIPLQEHLRVTGKKLAYPLEICITTLLEFGMSEEGLFRIAGGMSKVKRLKSAIDSGCFSCLIPEYRDVHVLASTLKLYLRELPEPLLTYHLHKEWMQCMQYPESQKIQIVRHLLNRLPRENRDNLAYLIQFLAKLTQHTENKMSSSNIAIVMAPNLLWNKNEEINVNMGNCVTINMLVELFVKEVNTLFPEDVSQFVTLHNLLPDEDPFSRNGNNGRSSIEHVDATSTESLLDSPKPNLRKKKPAAPIPPNNSQNKGQQDVEIERVFSGYPSGSATLSRPPKGRDPTTKVKTTVGVNTEENDLSLSRKRSFSKEDIKLVTVTVPSVVATTHSNVATRHDHVPIGHMTGHSDTATGHDSVATGHGNIATDHSSVATGHSNVATGHSNVATGHNSVAPGHTDVLTGHNNVATGHGTVAINLNNVTTGHIPNETNLVSEGGATRVVTQSNVHVSKAQPVIRPVAQNVEEDKVIRTTVTHQVGHPSEGTLNSSPKPVAAPRQSLMTDPDKPVSVSRNSSMRGSGDVMSKSHNSMDYSDVQLRRTEMLDKPAKPEIPARPASLAPKRSSLDVDPTIHRTQCSVYSVANKQQPSIVNIPSRTEKILLGHDIQMAEKERFLGHQPSPRSSLENKFNDINSNKDRDHPSTGNKPSIPPKSLISAQSNETLDVVRSNERLEQIRPNDNTLSSPDNQTLVSKSNEKLNDINDKLHSRQRASHTRTRSDGNIMEFGKGESLLQTPPSPRSLNKPTEPPPPPPVVKKPEPQSTDF